MLIRLLIPASTEAALNLALETLVVLNLAFLTTTQGVPSLYSSGVKYQREPKGREDWLTLPLLLERGVGDCEDLAAARAAELRHAGERGARAIVKRVRPGLWHCLVRRADGRLEDPSKKLGMKGAG